MAERILPEQVQLRDLKAYGHILHWPIAINNDGQVYYADANLPFDKDGVSEYSNRRSSGREIDSVTGPVVDLSAAFREVIVFLDGEDGEWVKTYWLKEDEAYYYPDNIGGQNG